MSASPRNRSAKRKPHREGGAKFEGREPKLETASSPNWFPARVVRTPLCGHRISSRRSPDRASKHCETESRCAAISAGRWSASDVLRKKMAVALDRKLLIALWRMTTTGEIPQGIVLHPVA
jgi:hypothetical protein